MFDLSKEFPALAGLPPSLLDAIGANLRAKDFRPGETVFAEGDAGDALYLVLEGSAEVVAKAPSGPVTLAALNRGDVFGEIALLVDNARRSASVICSTALRTLVLDRAVFETLMDRYPQARAAWAAQSRRMLVFDFLRLVSPFSKLDAHRLRQLAERVESLTAAAGTNIISQGETGDACYLVRAGRVEVIQRDGDSERQIATLGPGALFGEMALLTDAPRNATVRALVPTELLILHRDQLLDAIGAEQQVAGRMFELLTLRDRPRQVPAVVSHQRRSADGEIITVLKDAQRGAYYRLSPQGWFIWQRLDGRHNLKDLTLDCFEEFKVFAPHVIGQTVAQLHAAGFVTSEAAIDPEYFAAPHLTWWQSLALKTRGILQWRAVVRHVDPFFSALYDGGARYLFRWPAQIALAATAAGGLALFVAETPHLKRQAAHFMDAGTAFWIVVAALLLSAVLHEFGHALTTKAFGREVLAIGLGWYWFGPIFYVDTSDMWLAERWPRIAVSLAGGYTNLILAGIAAAAAWWSTNLRAAEACWIFASTSYFLVLANLNPLMEYDGYFVLIDWLDRPNLRPHCLQWLRSGLPQAWRRPRELWEHRLELVFGLGSLAYIVLASWLTALLYRSTLQSWISRIGSAELATALGWFTVMAVVMVCVLGLVADLRAAGSEPAMLAAGKSS